MTGAVPTCRYHIQLSAADVLRYSHYAFRRASLRLGWRSILFWLVLGGLLCWPFLQQKDWWGMGLFALGYAAIVAVYGGQTGIGRWLYDRYGRPRRWMKWWVRRQVRKRCRQTDIQWYLQPWQVQIGPKAIEAVHPAGSLRIPVSQLQVIETFDYFFCSHRGGGPFIILPKSQLPQAPALSQLLQPYHRQRAA